MRGRPIRDDPASKGMSFYPDPHRISVRSARARVPRECDPPALAPIALVSMSRSSVHGSCGRLRHQCSDTARRRGRDGSCGVRHWPLRRASCCGVPPPSRRSRPAATLPLASSAAMPVSGGGTARPTSTTSSPTKAAWPPRSRRRSSAIRSPAPPPSASACGTRPSTGRRHVSCTTRSFPPAEPARASRAGESFARKALEECASGIEAEAMPAASRCSRCVPRVRAESPGNSSWWASTSRTPSARRAGTPGTTRCGHGGDPQRRRLVVRSGSMRPPARTPQRAQGRDPAPTKALQGRQREGAPPERRLRTRGRHGYATSAATEVATQRRQTGSLGERGGEVHAVLRRCVGLHAVARDAAHRTLSGPHGFTPLRLLPLDRPASIRAEQTIAEVLRERGYATAISASGTLAISQPTFHPSGFRPLLRLPTATTWTSPGTQGRSPRSMAATPCCRAVVPACL